MNLLVEDPLDPYKLQVNEEILKYIIEKTKRPPVIITCIGSGSFYNEYSVNKFLTCLESRADYTIVEAQVTHDRDATKGITLWREIYRKNGNSAEDQAIFVFNLSRDYTTDENYFNQLVAFAKIISSVILQTAYGILWKDTDGRFSKWIENQEKVLKKKAQVARRYTEDFCKFGEEIFANEFAVKVFPEEFGDFVRGVAKLVEAELHPILNGINGGNGQNSNGTMNNLEYNSDVNMHSQEIRDQSHSISLNAESLPNLIQSSTSGSTTITMNVQSKSSIKNGANQINSNPSNVLESDTEIKNQPMMSNQEQEQVKIGTFLIQQNVYDKKEIETQTDHNSSLIDFKENEKEPLLILTKNSCLNKQIQEMIIENIYKEIERKVEVKEIHYSSIDQLVSNFNTITTETLEQFEVYKPENGQNQIMKLGQNLLQPLELLEKFQNSEFYQNWGKVFKSVDMLYTKLGQDFLEKIKDIDFDEWDLQEWTDSLMSNICNKNGINLEIFKRSTNAIIEFPKVLKSFQDIIKVIIIYDDDVKNYFSKYMKNLANGKFEDYISKFLEISIFKAGFDDDVFLNAGEYFQQILNKSVKIRSQIIYFKIYPENEKKMEEDCAKLGNFMKIKFESKMNEFFPTKTLSTAKEIKRIANEFKTFCFEYISAKFQLWHEGVSEIWKKLELDIEDVVRNEILIIDAFGAELEKIILAIETSTYKLAESKASSLTYCQEESASHFRNEISKKSNLLFDYRVQEIIQNIETNFFTYQEKYEASIQANSSQRQDHANKSQTTALEVNLCINLDYDMIEVMIIKDNPGKINLEKLQRNLLKNQIGLDSQGLLCIGSKAENLKNKICGSEILNPDTQFVYELGNIKLSKLELLALILKHIKMLIENKYSAQIKKCILVVPTFLSMGLKSLLKMSAKIAGLNDVEILTESIAVAIYYYYAIFEKKLYTKQDDYLLFSKVERSQIESWLVLMKKNELQIREVVNCAMLSDYFFKGVQFNAQLNVQLPDEEIPKILKYSHLRCLKEYETRYSNIYRILYSISFKNILYSSDSDEKIKNMLKPDVDLSDETALLGGIIWANKQFLDDSNLRNLKISTSAPYIINISTEDEKFSRSLKKYSEFYQDPSNFSSLSLKSIGKRGAKNFKFNISEVIAKGGLKTLKILNQIQLEWKLSEEDGLTWNFDQDGTLNFFMLVQPNQELLPIKSTWIFNSTPMNEENLQKSSNQVEKIYSGELNEIFKDRKELEEMMNKSKLDMDSKKDLNQTLKGRLEEIFKEITKALANEKSFESSDHLKELKEKLEKYNRILSK